MIKTTLHAYRFDVRNPEEAKAWVELKAKLASHPHRMKSHGGGSHYRPELAGPITLITEDLFSNQWNTTCGHRVFDWAQDYTERPSIKQGHYLEQTEEMREIRRSTYRCGYCGKQERPQVNTFCQSCLGSPYLKEGDLSMLRMLPVEEFRPSRAISAEELQELMPAYIEAQMKVKAAKEVKLREKIREEADKAIELATIERDGKLWMLDHKLSLDNLIFYKHTETFTLGWCSPLSDSVKAGFQEAMKDFPFKWEFAK